MDGTSRHRIFMDGEGNTGKGQTQFAPSKKRKVKTFLSDCVQNIMNMAGYVRI
jgi:hypothetical protein